MEKLHEEVQAVETQEVVTNIQEETALVAPHADASIMIQEKELTDEEFEARLEMAQKLTSYVGAESKKIDTFIGKEILLAGAITHDATVKKEAELDLKTGEIIPETLIAATRTVFKLADGTVIGMVSAAAETFCNNVLFPLFGKGDFRKPIKVKVSQISAKGSNRTYAFQIVK